jgi:hypothetical protein
MKALPGGPATRLWSSSVGESRYGRTLIVNGARASFKALTDGAVVALVFATAWPLFEDVSQDFGERVGDQ